MDYHTDCTRTGKQPHFVTDEFTFCSTGLTTVHAVVLKTTQGSTCTASGGTQRWGMRTITRRVSPRMCVRH